MYADVGDFRYFVDGVRKSFQAVRRYTGNSQLELDVCQNRCEVCVAAALAKARQCSLYVHRARLQRHDAVGNRHAAVVVRMNAYGNGKPRGNEPGCFVNVVRKGSAVRIAEAEAVRAALNGCFQRLQGIVGVGLVAVEKMLRVVDYFLAAGFQVSYGFRDHAEVFFQLCAQNFRYVDIPGFAEDGDAFRPCGKQRADVCVVFHRNVLAPGASECRELGVTQRVRAKQLKELHVLGVGAGVSGFDIIHAEVVEQARNL